MARGSGRGLKASLQALHDIHAFMEDSDDDWASRRLGVEENEVMPTSVRLEVFVQLMH